MKVSELIEFLKKENPEAEVLLSSDEEGNSFEPADGGFAFGNFDVEKDKKYPFKIQDQIYHADASKLHGDYIIIYPL
jgi:hypothetical protein